MNAACGIAASRASRPGGCSRRGPRRSGSSAPGASGRRGRRCRTGRARSGIAARRRSRSPPSGGGTRGPHPRSTTRTKGRSRRPAGARRPGRRRDDPLAPKTRPAGRSTTAGRLPVPALARPADQGVLVPRRVDPARVGPDQDQGGDRADRGIGKRGQPRLDPAGLDLGVVVEELDHRPRAAAIPAFAAAQKPPFRSRRTSRTQGGRPRAIRPSHPSRRRRRRSPPVATGRAGGGRCSPGRWRGGAGRCRRGSRPSRRGRAVNDPISGRAAGAGSSGSCGRRRAGRSSAGP